MLVLSRKPNQSIVIGSDIVVTVIEVKGDQVRLGIKAPRHVAVHRDEVAAEIRSANQEAARTGAVPMPKLPRPKSVEPTSAEPELSKQDLSA